MIDPRDLVHFIVWFSRERGEHLTTLRLVKFLYLADLYFARENAGRTITGWPWAFVHFGPFCGEALDAIRSAVRPGMISAQEFRSKYDKDFQLYNVDDPTPPRIRDMLPTYVTGPLQDAIRRFADDTPALLDYVYFHTEPMFDANPGDRLDFSRATRSVSQERVAMRQLHPAQIRRAREATRSLAERYRRSVEVRRTAETQGIYDDDYIAALRALGDTEPERTDPIKGAARLKPE